MQTIILPGGLRVTRIVMGSNFESDPSSYRLLDQYLAGGGCCFDTARLYADGRSEENLGAWMKLRGNRQEVVISTKGCHPPVTNMRHSRLSGADILGDLDASLTALRTDYIDLYWLHRDDPALPVGPIMDTLNGAVRAGKIRALGASNWTAARIREANEYAARAGLSGFVASQIQWSLAGSDRKRCGDATLVVMNEEEYDWYRQNQFPVFAFTPMAHGYFQKKAAGQPLSEKLAGRFESAENEARLERLRQLAARKGAPIGTAALSYLLHRRLPGAVVAGARTPGQLAESIAADSFPLTPEECDWLERG